MTLQFNEFFIPKYPIILSDKKQPKLCLIHPYTESSSVLSIISFTDEKKNV